ncbi:cytochrome c-type biogenesis protein [Marinomonas atlantica]|uniref:cytochrome c-type biogenesis protein n=1 Tax=Marinomonas atlantica TaxID=1806668 RepID=UPI000832CB8E|nr:cytochrome c-type biogenesis protein [Marinomonas atlantica]MCO4786894.1 cytochrome c-type biogenesis protein CcmH [Marinomonas atlantica]
MIGRCLASLLVVLATWSSTSIANDVLAFDAPEQQQRYRILIEELRCPKCQNQNLEDSNAGIAIDLRNQVYKMINDGQSNEQIIDYMVARYGEFVLYRPVHNASTALLWYGPFALVVIGTLIFVLVIVRNKRHQSKKDSES